MNPLNTNWFSDLNDEEMSFIKKFIIASGSLKELASNYGVTYPTVRLRLDRLISRINLTENSIEDSFINSIKNLALDEKISLDAAKILIKNYRKTIGGNKWQYLQCFI